MSDKEQMRNYSQSNGYNINCNTSPYGAVYQQSSQKYKQGLNQYQNQDLLQYSQKFENQYEYYQQQQDMYQDNDSFLSSNLIPQNPPSQEEICDIYMNPKPYHQNQEKSQYIEDQSTMILPSYNQDIFFDTEEPEYNLNYEQNQTNRQDVKMNPYCTNMKNQKNQEYFSQNPYINQNQNEIDQYVEQNPNQFSDYPIQRQNLIQSKNIFQNQNQQQNLNQKNNLIQNQNINSMSSQNQGHYYIQNHQSPQLQINNKPIKLENENQLAQTGSQSQFSQFLPINNTQQNYQVTTNLRNSPQYQQNIQNGEYNQQQDQNIAHNHNNVPLYYVQQKAENSESTQNQEIDNNLINQCQRFEENPNKNNLKISESQQCFFVKNNEYSQDQSSNKNYSSQNIGSDFYCNDNEINETDQNEQYSSKSHTIQSSYDQSQENYSKSSQRRKQRGQEQNSNTPLESKKAIKKYQPKKKYKQSRQKNVFKNFGNALTNCIQNNFVIRDFIEKRLSNDANAIDNFHNYFLKDYLHHLKNKEDFLQGWSIQEKQDNEQIIHFKQVFKEVSLRFFNEYAAKYVNESDKLKNKDIHIKAIPIFIRGIQNVNELYKFKLS